ncbi:MAG: hypothetical protein WAW88_10625, partial [Nocardioides sp.]
LITVPARGRDLGATADSASATSLALGDRLDCLVQPSQRPALNPRGLTTQQQLRDEDTVEHPGQ